MSTETKELLEQVRKQAPKEFTRVKQMRNYVCCALLAIVILNGILGYYLTQLSSQCILIFLSILAMVLVGFWLRETWKCPVCYKSPGFSLGNPKFCSACGTKLEE